MFRVESKNGRFYIDGGNTFQHKEFIKSSGFCWDSVEKQWHTGIEINARMTVNQLNAGSDNRPEAMKKAEHAKTVRQFQKLFGGAK